MSEEKYFNSPKLFDVLVSTESICLTINPWFSIVPPANKLAEKKVTILVTLMSVSRVWFLENDWDPKAVPVYHVPPPSIIPGAFIEPDVPAVKLEVVHLVLVVLLSL